MYASSSSFLTCTRWGALTFLLSSTHCCFPLLFSVIQQMAAEGPMPWLMPVMIERARWIPDSQAPQCPQCRQNFSLMFRRHHCRACGGVYCGNCTFIGLALQGSNQKERVCVNCFSQSRIQAQSTRMPNGTSQGQAALPQELEAKLQEYAFNNEINPKYLASLRHLINYDVVIVCDDSGSMSSAADPDIPNISRWQELQQSCKLVLDATSALGQGVDVYFMNRGTLRNVTSYNELLPKFAEGGPSGSTPTRDLLDKVWREKVTPDMARPLLIHVFTDGIPDGGVPALGTWLRSRRVPSMTYVAFLLCTDEESIVRNYRPLENEVILDRNGVWCSMGIRGVDVTEDFRGERRDVQRLRGFNYPFSMGDYIVKCLAGCVDPQIHLIDLPPFPQPNQDGDVGDG
jgi:hypothetical protein